MPRQIATALLRPGMKLGRSIYDERGRVLLRRGVELKEAYIARLKHYFSSVYIEDRAFDGIEVPQVIADEQRHELQRMLADEWGRVAKAASFERVAFSRNFARSLSDQMRNLMTTVRFTTCIQEDLSALAGYDNATYVHSVNVAIYALAIGAGLGLPDGMLLDLGVGALLHDIGKLWVPGQVLNKPDRLTAEEYEQVQKHAAYGHDMLVRQPELSYQIAHCAFQHHERMNGSGYPRRLRGDEIHLFGKILAVADVYDAMVMHRPYRPGVSPADVMEYLFSSVGSLFDLEIVSLFSRKVSMYPVGTQVLLSDGRVAAVVGLREAVPSRPLVRVLGDQEGGPVDIDLSVTLNLTIVHAGDVTIYTAID